MNVTKAVIKDLLPLYQEGEVSEDTRLLVEEYLASDAELRNLAAGASAIRGGLPARPQADAWLATLEKTKRAIRRQKWLQFFALFLTLAPFSFAFQNGELKYLLVRDAPWSLLPLWGGAAGCWLGYWRSRQLRVR